MHRIFLNYRTPLFLLLLSFVICQSMAYAGVVSVLGPRTFMRKTGKPFIESASFTVKNRDLPYTLKVYNGGLNSECSRVSSAVITLNGIPVFSPSDFNQQVYILQKQVPVAADNQLQVELRSIPGSCLSVMLEGAGNTSPLADAGPDQTVYVAQTVTLDGSRSTDADGNPLTFRWSLVSVPGGSLAALSNSTEVHPGFSVDIPGTYMAQLIVNDGTADSVPDTVIINTENSTPVANAGPDQTVLVTDTVQLNGSKSSDVDGNPLTFEWSFASKPAGSIAFFNNPLIVNPTFTVDLPGAYVAQLIVNDGTADSSQDSVTITTVNSPPLANAGPDQTVHVTDTVQLNGSKSSDVDGNPLAFKWSFTSVPTGSAAALSNSTAVNPIFTVDLPGVYVAQLIVNDGSVDSLPDTVIITTENSSPVANAGPDQTHFVGSTVTMDGTSSHDVDGDFMNYSWSLTSLPTNSTTVLSNTTLPITAFSIDRPGIYVAQLIVNDGKLNSPPDTAVITTTNSQPVANAGPDQAVIAGNVVTLDGSGSNDADYDPLTYQWSFTSKPAESSAALSDPAAVGPNFTADIAGTYVSQLIVNDGMLNSNPETVTVTATEPQNLPPVTADDSYTLYNNGALSVSAPGLLANDIDPEGKSLAAVLATGVSNGTLALNADGSFIYTPNANFSGMDSFTYTANDGHLNGNSATVAIVVMQINMPPVADAGPDQAVIVGNTVRLTGIGSKDPDGDPLTYQWSFISKPDGSSTVLSDPAAVSPSFGTDAAGSYVIQLIVGDGALSSAPVFMTVTAKPVPALKITLTSPLNGEALSSSPASVEGVVSDPAAYVSVNGTEASVAPDGKFTAHGVRLYEGLNEIVAQASAPGQTAQDTVQVTYQRPAVQPDFTILSPVQFSAIESSKFNVTGVVADPAATVMVNDTLAKVDDDGFYSASVYACDNQWGEEGGNLSKWSCDLTVTAYSKDGQSISSNTITYTYIPSQDPFTIAITAPAHNQIVTYSPYEIQGELHDVLSAVSSARITVNGITPSTYGIGENNFSASITLNDGLNYITVRATNAVGHDAFDTIKIIYDLPDKPLGVSIYAPLDQAIVNYSPITVFGGVTHSAAEVDVSGVYADVDKDLRSFKAISIPLSPGENLITATVWIPSEETATDSRTVIYDPNYPSPPAPVLSQLPIKSANSYITLSGLTLPGYSAEIFVNGKPQTTVTADNKGLFTATGYLPVEGPNHISAWAIDIFGNKSSLSGEAIVILDAKKPFSSDNIYYIDYYDLAASRFIVGGRTKPSAEVLIIVDGDLNYKYKISANEDGYYGAPINMTAGHHIVYKYITDWAGRKTTSHKFFTLHDPESYNPIPPKIDPLPTPANETSISVEGNAYSGFNVEVYRNNELIGTVNADSRGRYRLEGVTLVPGTNTLKVRQKEGMADLGSKNLTLKAADSAEVIVELISGTPSRPAVKIDFPIDGTVTDAEVLPLRGTISDPDAILRLNGYYNASGYAQNQGGRFVSNQLIPLLPGKNILWIEATAPDGSRGVDKITVYSRRDADVPLVHIDSHAESEEVYDQLVSVTGTTADTVQKVVINDAEANIGSGSFTGQADIMYGHSYIMLTAWGIDANGRIGHHDVPLQYKYVPTPQVYISSHFDGELVSDSLITVTGQVSDSVSVTINGVQAIMDGNTFTAQIEIKEGQNAITVIAKNSVKAKAQTINVTYNPALPISLQSLTIEPSAIYLAHPQDSNTIYLPRGDSLQLKLTGTYSNGQTVDLTQQAQWASSNTNATVNKGLMKASIAIGGTNWTTINAAISGLTSSRLIYVGPPVLKNIKVGYEWGTGYQTDNPEIKAGEALQLKAFGVYTDGSVMDISSKVTWSSETVSVAAIDSNGLATAMNKGTTQISASSQLINTYGEKIPTGSGAIPTYQSISGNTTLTVTLPPVYIFITTPTDESTINASTTTVTGKILGTSSDIGITVNGITATVAGDIFTANNVPLLEGTNKITATATSNNGQTVTHSITITRNFAVNTIGDYGNVTVMEFTGNYDANNPDGTNNSLPRREIAKELFKTHQDNYDILIAFTNFEFAMSGTETEAYYTEIKNDTQGIGKESFDNTALFGSNGNLQGMIDMGNITAKATNPDDLEETLSTLAHEFAHRWAANVKYKDASGNPSTALLGIDGSHWSYFLDTGGSVLYGNAWKDNTDGTFTSTGAVKRYSPLDLYLMGMIDKAEVPPMLLLQNQYIDPATMPTPGATITGTPGYVTIDDITAAEGERVPDATASQKTFRIGYILLTQPATFTGNESGTVENIRNAWAGRFKTLTGGKGSIADITPSMTVTIASPSGDIINGNKTTVTGSVINSTGNETGVTVNGIPATVFSSSFIANNVQLTEGANIITVTATDTAGNTQTTTKTITATPPTGSYIKLTSNIESGTGPLEVILTIDAPFEVSSSYITATGPIGMEYLSMTVTEYRIKLIVEGTYTFTAHMTDINGNTYQDTTTVTVLGKIDMDNLLKAKWEGMKAALGSGDVERAVAAFFHERSQETYRTQFTALKPVLNMIIGGMGDISLVSASDGRAVYEIRTTRNGTIYSFQLLFEKDSSGVWKIRNF